MKFRFPKGIKNFEVPIYGTRVYLTTKQSEVDAIDRYMHLGGIEWHLKRHAAAFLVHEVQERTGIPLYLLVFRRPSPQVIVHEVAHLALTICGNLGIGFGSTREHDEQEPFCYLLDWLFTKVTAELKR